MKQWNKRILFVLAAVLSVALFITACGGGDGHDPRAFQDVPVGDWRTPFENTVNVTAVGDQGAHWTFEGNDSIEDSPWTRLFYDELNIQVEFLWTSIDEYETRLNLDIAAGNLADVFFIPSGVSLLFYQLQADGMLLDLTHAYRNYASQRIRDFELVDPYTIQGFTIDGNIYGIPRYYYGQIDQPWHLWVRNDWYGAAGSPNIRTVADLENLARTFMDDHGAAYGIAVAYNLQWLFRTAPMFGAYVGDIHDHQYFWMPDETGRLRPCISFPEFQDALAGWARWFEEGLISPDFATMTNARVEEDIVNGVVGIQPWWQWWGWMNGPSIATLQGDDALFYPHNLPTVAGDRPARGQIFFPNHGVHVASADFENPAALMKILSMVDHMRGSPDANLTDEQIRYFMDGDREHAMTSTFSIIDPHTDMVQFEYVERAIRTGDSSQLFTSGMLQKYSQSMLWLNHRDTNGIGAFLQMGFDGSAYARSQHLFDNGWTIQTALWGLQPAEFQAAGATGDIILEQATQIIMGNRPVSDWPAILEQWYAQGGQLKEDIMNEMFGN